MTRPRRCNRPPSKRLLRWRAPVLTLFLWACALAWDKTGVLRWGLLAALLHETGHLLAWAAFVGRQAAAGNIPAGVLPFAARRLFTTLAGKAAGGRRSGRQLSFVQRQSFLDGLLRPYLCRVLVLGGEPAAGCFNFLPLPGLDGARLFGREP